MIGPSKVLLPLLHIKLGLIKNFVRTLDRDGSVFFLCEKFKRKSMEKPNVGIFDGPEIRELMKDASFDIFN